MWHDEDYSTAVWRLLWARYVAWWRLQYCRMETTVSQICGMMKTTVLPYGDYCGPDMWRDEDYSAAVWRLLWARYVAWWRLQYCRMETTVSQICGMMKTTVLPYEDYCEPDMWRDEDYSTAVWRLLWARYVAWWRLQYCRMETTVSHICGMMKTTVLPYEDYCEPDVWHDEDYSTVVWRLLCEQTHDLDKILIYYKHVWPSIEPVSSYTWPQDYNLTKII